MNTRFLLFTGLVLCSTIAQAQAPDAVRAHSDQIQWGGSNYDFDHGGPLLAGKNIRLADCGNVDPEAPFLNGYVRPDMIHQFLLRDDLTWSVGKIDQIIQRPIPEGKHSTVAPEHPLANRKLKRAEP